MTESDRRANEGNRSGHAEWRQVEQRHHEPAEGDLATDIVVVVAAAEGIEPSELRPPLYEAVDAAALEETFFGQNARSVSRQSAGTVDFHYAGYRVAVESGGWIRVYEPAD